MAVFGSSQVDPGSPAWDDAVEAGSMLAGAGFAVVTGGYGGVMEAASRGAAEAGGHVIGVTAPALFPQRGSGPNPYVKELIEAETLPRRIEEMVQLAAGVLVLPGSIGTATELLLAWNLNHIARRAGQRSLPTVAVGPTWALLAGFLVDHADAYGGDIHHAPDVREGVTMLLRMVDDA